MPYDEYCFFRTHFHLLARYVLSPLAVLASFFSCSLSLLTIPHLHPSVSPYHLLPPLRLIVLGIIHLVSVMKSEGGTDRGGKKKKKTQETT